MDKLTANHGGSGPDLSLPSPKAQRWLAILQRALLVVVVAAMVALVVGHRYLPMNDSPSHIANAVIASGLRHGDAFFRLHYEIQHVPLPYWMAALLQMGLQAVLPPLAAYQALVALYVVLMPWAFVRLYQAAQPGRGEAPYAALVALMGFNWAYHLGEINFILGQPFLMLACAAFLRLGRSGALRDLAGFVLWACAVYLCHIYALSALGVCLGCNVGLRWAGLREAGEGPGTAAVRPLAWLALLVAAALFALAAYLVFIQHGTSANRGTPGFDLSPRKAAHLLIDLLDSPTLGGAGRALVLVGLLALLLGPIVWAQRSAPRSPSGWSTRWGAPTLLLPGGLLWLIAYAGPAHILGADGTIKEAEIATRFTLSGALLLLAGLRLPAVAQARHLRVALLLVVALLAGVKLRDEVRLHRAFAQRMALFDSQILGALPTEQRVLPLMDMPGATMADYLYHRVGNYVVVVRHGYSPHVFAVLGQHALRHRQRGDYRQVDDLQITPDEWASYDYLLVQSERPEPAVPGLGEHAVLRQRAAGFALYQVVHSAGGQGTHR